MYYCNDCNQFITPILADDGATDVCMYCGSEDIEKASQCVICGKPIKSSEDYCEECLKLAERYLQGILKNPIREEEHILELAIQLHTTIKKARGLILAEMEKRNGRSNKNHEHI